MCCKGSWVHEHYFGAMVGFGVLVFSWRENESSVRGSLQKLIFITRKSSRDDRGRQEKSPPFPFSADKNLDELLIDLNDFGCHNYEVPLLSHKKKAVQHNCTLT